MCGSRLHFRFSRLLVSATFALPRHIIVYQHRAGGAVPGLFKGTFWPMNLNNNSNNNNNNNNTTPMTAIKWLLMCCLFICLQGKTQFTGKHASQSRVLYLIRREISTSGGGPNIYERISPGATPRPGHTTTETRRPRATPVERRPHPAGQVAGLVRETSFLKVQCSSEYSTPKHVVTSFLCFVFVCLFVCLFVFVLFLA